jgi:hypothetical protein
LDTSFVAVLLAGIVAGMLAAVVLNAALNWLVQTMLDLVRRVLEAIKLVALVLGALAVALLAGWGLADLLLKMR